MTSLVFKCLKSTQILVLVPNSGGGFFGYTEDRTWGEKNTSQQTCLRVTREETEATE